MTLTKYIRTNLGITVKDLATLSGLSPSEVSLIENGRLKPTTAQLAKLAEALHVTVPAILVEEARLTDAQRTALAQVPA